MAFDRKSASAKRDLQRTSPTIVQKREIFERRTRKSKALKVMYFLSRPIGAAFGLSSLFYHHCLIETIEENNIMNEEGLLTASTSVLPKDAEFNSLNRVRKH